MEAFTIPVLLVYAAFLLAALIIIPYLIVNRIKNRGKEGFEERDN